MRRKATGLLLPALLLAGLLVFGNGLAVQRLYTDTSLHKPDYRAAAERIAANLQPGDVVLVDGPDPEKVFKHYFRADAPVHAVGYLQDAAYDTVGKELAPLLQGAQAGVGGALFPPAGRRAGVAGDPGLGD